MSATGRALAGTGHAPADSASTRGEHFRELVGARKAVYALAFGAAGIFVLGAQRHSGTLMILGPLVWVAAVLGVCLIAASRRAETDFFAGYAASAGLRFSRRGELPEMVPLLSAGDRRETTNVLSGEIESQPLTFAHYEYEIRDEYRGSEHTRERHRFSVCVMPVSAPTGLDAGIFVHARRGVVDRLVERDWLGAVHTEAVDLESSAFAERFELRAARGVDPIALRRLFAPSFLAWIAEHPLEPKFEYRAGVLAVYLERELDDGGNVTFFLDAARHIADRFAARVDRPLI
jgi:hypothetical protein